jgi:3-hydroxybutyryl-CoA dehydratase
MEVKDPVPIKSCAGELAMKILGVGYCWEELAIGDKFRTLRRTVTETDLVNFISVTGMLEAIFIDATHGDDKGAIRGRFVPGALTYTLIEGLQCQGFFQGTGLAMLELEQKVLKPVFLGDTIYAEVEVVGVRPTSRGGRAIVSSINNIFNHKADLVITYKAVRMMAGRIERDAVGRAPNEQST